MKANWGSLNYDTNNSLSQFSVHCICVHFYWTNDLSSLLLCVYRRNDSAVRFGYPQPFISTCKRLCQSKLSMEMSLRKPMPIACSSLKQAKLTGFMTCLWKRGLLNHETIPCFPLFLVLVVISFICINFDPENKKHGISSCGLFWNINSIGIHKTSRMVYQSRWVEWN